MTCIKITNKQDQFKKKNLSKEKKEHVHRFILAYFKLLIAKKITVSCDISNRSRDSIAKFITLFRFFVLILDKTLEKTIRNAMAKSSKTRLF